MVSWKIEFLHTQIYPVCTLQVNKKLLSRKHELSLEMKLFSPLARRFQNWAPNRVSSLKKLTKSLPQFRL